MAEGDRNEFVVLNEYIPHWRAPRRLPRIQSVRPMLSLLSVLTLVFLAIPPAEGYAFPLSMLFARLDLVACCGFAALVGTVLYLAADLWISGYLAPVFGCGLVLALLFCIFRTDPMSSIHFGLFLLLVVVVLGFHWYFSAAFECRILSLIGLWMLVSVGACLVALGVGERMMILGSLAAIHVMLIEHLPPP